MFTKSTSTTQSASPLTGWFPRSKDALQIFPTVFLWLTDTPFFRLLSWPEREEISRFVTSVNRFIFHEYLPCGTSVLEPSDIGLGYYFGDEIKERVSYIQERASTHAQYQNLSAVQKENMELFFTLLDQSIDFHFPHPHCLGPHAGVGEGGRGAAAAPSPGLFVTRL